MNKKPLLLAIIAILFLYLIYDRYGEKVFAFWGESARLEQEDEIKNIYSLTAKTLSVQEKQQQVIKAIQKAQLLYHKSGSSTVGAIQVKIQEACQRAGVQIEVAPVNSDVRQAKGYNYVDYIDIRVTLTNASINEFTKVLKELEREKTPFLWQALTISKARLSAAIRKKDPYAKAKFRITGTVRAYVLNSSAEKILEATR